MIKKFTLLLFSASIFTFTSCENELDLTAEYDETIVVYGLLDETQDTQWVKINKSFLGDGNAMDYAQEPDSFIYKDIYASLTNLSNSSEIVLEPFAAPKESGIFADGKNIVYITDQEIVGGAKYRLKVVNNNSGETATATTTVIDTVKYEGKALRYDLSLVTFITPSGVYEPLRLEYGISPHAFRYESKVIFHYTEYPKSNPSDTTHKQVIFDLGNKLASQAFNDKIVFLLSGEYFYKSIAEKLTLDLSVQREIVDMEFVINAASKELQLYINANGELDGIAQVRPEFTNVVNGYGLFCSKHKSSFHRFLSIDSAQELKSGDYTRNLNFVDNE